MREPRDRNGMTAIVRKEIREIAGGVRSQGSSLVLVAVMALAALTGGARYHSEAQEAAAVLQGYSQEAEGATVEEAAEILHPAVKPPWRLALVADGGQTASPNVYTQALSALVVPELRQFHGGNDRLPGRPALDWMFAFRVVLPLAAFLLGHDAICGERQAGTWKLLLSYPVPRRKVLAGKLASRWICLAIPVLAGAALSLVLAFGAEGVAFDRQAWLKAVLVVLLGLGSIVLYLLIALLASALSREPATSLSVLVWLWVTGVLVVPAVSEMAALRLRPVPADGEVRSRIEAVDRRIAREHAGRVGRWRQAEWAAADGFAWERASAAAENRRFALQEEVRRDRLRRKVEQARLARRLASLSPVSLLGEAAERVAGAGLERDESYFQQAWRFRSVLAESVRQADAGDDRSPHILFFSGYLSQRRLPAGALPRFVFRERSVRQGLTAAFPALAVLALETAVLGAAALFVFSRPEVG